MLAGELADLSQTLFARVRIAADEPQRVLPSKDGVELKNRFRRAVAARRRITAARPADARSSYARCAGTCLDRPKSSLYNRAP